MQEVFKILPQMLKDEGKEAAELDEAVVFAAWRRVAGETLCERAVPFRLSRRTLILAVADENWKRHLESLSGQMLFKLNGALSKVAVTFIEFRIDAATVDAERARFHQDKTSLLERERIAMQNVPEKVRMAAETISDESLRRNFLLAAGSCLARRKHLKR